MVADNRLPALAQIDQHELATLMKDIEGQGFDVETYGFTKDEYDKLIHQIKPDDGEETQMSPELNQTSTNPTQNTANLNKKEEKPRKLGTPVIQYNIVFDNVDQQQQWFSFLVYLKKRFPQAETISQRLSLCISAELSQ